MPKGVYPRTEELMDVQLRNMAQGRAAQVRKTVEERFWEKVAKRDSGCWEWIGAKHGAGDCDYGQLRVNGHNVSALKVSYQIAHGKPVPEGLELDHLCRNHLCVNPAHLEPVTRQENIRRGVGPKMTSKFSRIVERDVDGRIMKTARLNHAK